MGCAYAERVRECEDDGNAGVVAVKAGPESMCCTHYSGTVSSARNECSMWDKRSWCYVLVWGYDHGLAFERTRDRLQVNSIILRDLTQ